MMQGQVRALDFRNCLETSSNLLRELLGYSIDESSISCLAKKEWNEFTISRRIDEEAEGVFLPRTRQAFVREESTFLALNSFHEYFGHGLFCEKSQVGRRLVELEKSLLEEERFEFDGREFLMQDLNKFREKNPLFLELQEFRQKNLGVYELFAVWVEYFLSRNTGFQDDFERKYTDLAGKEGEEIKNIIKFARNFGDLSTFYQFGIARRTNPERVGKILQDIYKEKLKNVKLAILYGSKKEFKDIDVFIVGNVQSVSSEFLDFSACPVKQFEAMASLLDVSITDPVVSGDYICGDKNYLEYWRSKMQNMRITPRMVEHNFKRGVEQQALARNYPRNSRPYLNGSQYALTYFTCSELLRRGIKRLTKGELVKFQSDYQQLKGGKYYET
jgi:hypothetical protein